ncbi:MAG TPA: STAS domain-containing protein [Chloroflexota bacterium]|nr:STAS domain-containing protein [Chloroflexota bacterium]HZU07441.1 STAS domain-containing protein [Chloroflexota bacterium]
MKLVIDTRPDGIAVLGWTEPTVLDASNADELRAQLRGVEQRCARLVLDLSQVEFVDSAIIGVLVGLLRRTRAAGGDVKLAALHPDIETIFEVTRLHRVFRIHPSVAAALQEFQSAAP